MNEKNTRTNHYQLSLPPEVAENIARQFMVRQGATEEYATKNLRSRTAVYHQLKLWQEDGMNI
jgi:hypothetical protein